VAKSIFAVRRFDLDDMIRSDEFDRWISDNLGQNLLLAGDDDRFDRITEAAENGEDGSFHAEHIQDWRDFLATLKLPRKVTERIESKIEECEKWHEANGTLWQQCG